MTYSANITSLSQPTIFVNPDFNEIDEKRGSRYMTPSMKPFKLTRDYVTKAFTVQGVYQEIVKLPTPILAYHPANLQALKEFDEQLSELFPELANLTDDDLENISRKRDDSE